MYAPESFKKDGPAVNLIGYLNPVKDKNTQEVTGYMMHAYKDQSAIKNLDAVERRPRCTPERGQFISVDTYEQSVAKGMHVVDNPVKGNKFISMSTTLRYATGRDSRGRQEITPDMENISGPGFAQTGMTTKPTTFEKRLAASIDIVQQANAAARERQQVIEKGPEQPAVEAPTAETPQVDTPAAEAAAPETPFEAAPAEAEPIAVESADKGVEASVDLSDDDFEM